MKVGPTADLTGERLRHCTVRLKAPLANASVIRMPGLSNIEGDGTVLRFQFRGDMEPLLRVLAELRVEEFLAEPEGLEEAFFEIYEGREP